MRSVCSREAGWKTIHASCKKRRNISTTICWWRPNLKKTCDYRKMSERNCAFDYKRWDLDTVWEEIGERKICFVERRKRCLIDLLVEVFGAEAFIFFVLVVVILAFPTAKKTDGEMAIKARRQRTGRWSSTCKLKKGPIIMTESFQWGRNGSTRLVASSTKRTGRVLMH